MTQRSLPRRTRLSFATLGALAVLTAAIFWIAPQRQVVSNAGRPGEEETAPMPRLADPTPLFAEIEPAKNPIRLCLQDDGRKVLGWISGTEELKGRPVHVALGDNKADRELIRVDQDNTFTWKYRLDKPTKVEFLVDTGFLTLPFIKDTITVAPAIAEKEPSVFFVVDRTAYRPTQSLNFAGFLRKLNAAGEFEPIANTDVDVQLVSQQKQTKAFKVRLTSDEHGKINGSYVFSDADGLDTYTLQIPGYKGSAKLLLSEYRKSKIRLKITGDVKEEKLDLKFETVDFLDKAVAASKLSFTIQVVEKTQADKRYPLKAEDFAYYTAIGAYTFDLDNVPEEDRLLWLAESVPPRSMGNLQAVVAQFQNDLSLNGAEPGKHTIDLKKEWKTGNFLVQVQGVVTDANGREQRATHTISLKCDKATPTQKLEVAKDTFVTGEKIVAKLTSDDGKPTSGATSLVVMKLAPAPQGGFVDYGFYGYNDYGYYGRGYRYPRQRWNYLPKEEAAKRTLVTALPLKNDLATVKLTEPGAYKLVAVTHHDDGRTTQCEAGLVVKNSDDLTPFALRLDKDEFNAGDRLAGTIFSRFGGARVLLTLRDSSGIRLAKPITLSDKGVARVDEPIPEGIKYACNVDLHYLDAKDFNHVIGRMIRVTPTDRMLKVSADVVSGEPKASSEVVSEVKPGQIVRLNLQVDRKEEVDLIVSVYDQSLLGINPDKSVDIRNFYLADERVRTMQARDLLRRKLGDVTLEAVLNKAEAILKGDPNPNDPSAQMLKSVIDQVRRNKYLYSPQLVTLLRLAGVEVMQNPMWYAYHGNSWYCPTGDNLKKTLREIVDHKHGEFYLVFGLAGDALMIHEMHPSWVNINPMVYYGRYYNRMNNLNGFDQMQGYGRSMRNMEFNARGDAHRSISGNSSGSFVPEAQGFISHMPIGPAVSAPLIDADPDQGHIAVRRDFSDSAFWNAAVRTDKDGKASVDFRVPDSLTNWQVVVTAVSKKMHVGQAKTSFRTFKPIMVWPMLPRSFVEGDRIEVFGAVHNRTDKGQSIKVRLKVENGEILSPEEKIVWVDAKSNVNVYWNFKAMLPGYTQLLMSVDCEAGSDASLKRLPVIRAAAEQIITKSGQVRDGTTFTIPRDVDLSSARLEISFAPSLAADMADTLNFLVDYPYGCVEQTMSRFLPAIKVAQILKQYEVNHPELLKKMPGVVAAGIKRLLELQQSDGGWGWHGGSQTHEMMTPYALYGLLQAEKAGYTIPNETAVQRGLQRLRYFIDVMTQPQQVADRIYCLYIYSHREKLEPSFITWLSDQQKTGKLSDYANALCVEMCVQQNQKDLAKKFVEDLRAKAQKNASGHISWKTAGFSRWMEDPFEITAAAMKAIVAFDKDDALIDGILGFFAATKRGDRWNSTKDTAMILFALCDYLAKANYNPDARNELTYTLNGKKGNDVKFDDKLTKKIVLDGSELKNGDNKLTFKTEMSGVMYRFVLRYWKSGRDIEPMDKGIKVTRKFYLCDERTKAMKELKDGDTVERGSYVVCDTTAQYSLPDGMRFMLMECPKPSTAEVIPVDDPRFANLQHLTGWALREERMASVAFHHEHAPQQIMNRVIMLAELSGDFVVPPAFVELMYQTEVRGHSGTFSLKVK